MYNTLFFDEEEAVKGLQERGYRVSKEEHLKASSVDTVPKLVRFFYARRLYYNPGRKYPDSIDYTNDRNYVSTLVKARQKLGLSRKAAIQECVQIIDALFKYEELLRLREPITNTRILTQTSIINRVCSFLNSEVPEAGEIDAQKIVDAHNTYYNKHFAGEDYLRADARRREILERLNEHKR